MALAVTIAPFVNLVVVSLKKTCDCGPNKQKHICAPMLKLPLRQPVFEPSYHKLILKVIPAGRAVLGHYAQRQVTGELYLGLSTVTDHRVRALELGSKDLLQHIFVA